MAPDLEGWQCSDIRISAEATQQLKQRLLESSLSWSLRLLWRTSPPNPFWEMCLEVLSVSGRQD